MRRDRADRQKSKARAKRSLASAVTAQSAGARMLELASGGRVVDRDVGVVDELEEPSAR